MKDSVELTRMIGAGRGDTPADLVIRDVQILDVVTGALTPSDIAIVGDRIVGTHDRYVQLLAIIEASARQHRDFLLELIRAVQA